MPIDDWCIRLPMEQTIAEIWNACLEDGLIKNAGWNQDIPGEGSVVFGFIASGEFETFPETCEILGDKTLAGEESYEIIYEIVNEWQGGFVGNITITNNGGKTIKDWQLGFTFENEITSLWNGELVSHEENHYLVRNPGYSQNLMPGESVTIGFLAAGIPGEVISSTVLEQTGLSQATTSQEETITVTIDTSVMTKHQTLEMYLAGEKLGTLAGSGQLDRRGRMDHRGTGTGNRHQ